MISFFLSNGTEERDGDLSNDFPPASRPIQLDEQLGGQGAPVLTSIDSPEAAVAHVAPVTAPSRQSVGGLSPNTSTSTSCRREVNNIYLILNF
jgi:hypothetical protein